MAAVANETEIKLRLGNPDGASELLLHHGFQVAVPRLFEQNFVYDNVANNLRASKRLLRLRLAGVQASLTFKGASVPGKHKVREERETRVENFDEMRGILEGLGYKQAFVYEKFRTEFREGASGVVTLDETPIGNFLEIEGEAEWIDQTAYRLGFTESDYLTESYGKLYAKWCEKNAVPATNMTFTGPRFEPDPTC